MKQSRRLGVYVAWYAVALTHAASQADRDEMRRRIEALEKLLEPGEGR